jgi:hypothetical protein
MEQSIFNSFEDFSKELLIYNRKRVHKKYSHLAFIILSNKKLPWSWYTEKMTQWLYWNMQGGVTGAGHGHTVYFENDLHDALHKVKTIGHTHAMVCQVGMMISSLGTNQVDKKPPIQNFYEFCKSDEFMRSHIICHPNAPATIHAQHVEINLEKWNGDSITDFGYEFTRSEENIHDDYTPLWIDTPNHPRIYNFTPEQREFKRYLYAHRNFEKNSKLVHDFIKNKIDNINYEKCSARQIKNFYKPYSPRYYYENNEHLLKPNGKKYDVIFTPSSGIFAEYLYETFGHKNTKTIIYDYNEKFLEYKRKILEYGFVGNDVLMYMNMLDVPTKRTPNMFGAIESNSKLLPEEKIYELQNNFLESNHEYLLCDLLTYDFELLKQTIQDKSVLFFASNVFQYIAVWMYYDYSDIKNQYFKLIEVLDKYSKEYNFDGRKIW